MFFLKSMHKLNIPPRHVVSKFMNRINCFNRIVSQTRKEQIIKIIHKKSTIK